MAETTAVGGKTNDAPAAAAVVPSAVLFKVGDEKRAAWRSFKHEKLLGMDASDLLEALAGSKMFSLDFKDVKLSACSIAVIKNAALPAGAEEPSAEHEAGDSVVEMKAAKTLGDVANGVGASGAPLFVRVGLPAAAAAAAAAALPVSPAAASHPIFPALPPPLVFTPTKLDGEDWFVTEVVHKRGVSVPVFLTAEQHAGLVRFVNEDPSDLPQALMPVGTIKSGKSTILRKLLPGMIAAEWASRGPSTRSRPVLFHFEFPLSCDAEAAAAHLQNALFMFGEQINIPFRLAHSPSAALSNLPATILEFAERVDAGGGELWLLLDELQGPGLGSTPVQAQAFTSMFKKVSILAMGRN